MIGLDACDSQAGRIQSVEAKILTLNDVSSGLLWNLNTNLECFLRVTERETSIVMSLVGVPFSLRGRKGGNSGSDSAADKPDGGCPNRRFYPQDTPLDPVLSPESAPVPLTTPVDTLSERICRSPAPC